MHEKVCPNFYRGIMQKIGKLSNFGPHTQTENVHIEPSSLANTHSHTSLPCGALERRSALLMWTMEGLDWPLQRRSRSGRAALSFAGRLEVSPGVSSRLIPQCLRRTRPPLWARRHHHFPELQRGGGRGLSCRESRSDRVGTDSHSVEDSYSVETWLKTGQLRGHGVDWKGSGGGWGSLFRIRTIRKGQAG